jgi:ubiquinone/menaquinone biosynthesis C-methylase UbiE
VIYQHPLAYLLGLQGIALMRAFNGEHDRDFTQARFAEIRALLDSADELGEAAVSGPVSVADGYNAWAARYDDPNDLIDLEQPVVRGILDRLPLGTALDAACGTGRHAAYLASLGHTVIGVDVSAKMLAVARDNVPGGDFRQADLRRLPVDDRNVDLVVCALALEHVSDLGPVFAEFARVLRPGGHLVISDSRMDYAMVIPLPDGRYGYLPKHRHSTSDYLSAALPVGFQVLRCEELRYPGKDPGAGPAAQRRRPEHPSDIWTLRAWCPAAFLAANNGSPLLIFWHYRLAGRTGGPE